jgi:hypothetical protein
MTPVQRVNHVLNMPAVRIDKLTEIKKALDLCHQRISNGTDPVWKHDHDFRFAVQKIIG